MTIVYLFFLGFILGLAYSMIGEKMPLLVKGVEAKEDNSWVLNLFIGVIHGLIMVVSYRYYGFGYEFLMSLVVSALTLIIFISDFKYMIILDSPLIIGSLFILAFRYYFYGWKNVGIALGSGAILFVFMLIISFMGKKIFKKDALGGGDIKLSFVIGLVLNLRLGLVAIIFSSLLALPYAIACMFLSKNREVPYGPFLVGSMALVFIFLEKFNQMITFIS